MLKKGLGCLGVGLVALVLIAIFAPDSAPEDAGLGDDTAATSSEPAASGGDPTMVTENAVEPEAATDGPKPGLTTANFERIRDGMTVDQVSDILGAPGEKVSETSAGGSTMAIYQWKGGMLSGRAVIGTFDAGKLMSKTQVGL